MVEIRRGSESGLTGERLPWLEPVEDEDDGGYGGPEEQGGGYGGVVAAMLAVLVVIAGITAGIAWFRHHRAATADIGEVIHPDPGPYKVKPDKAGGLDTDETGKVAAGTSAGEDIDSVLDLNKVPEQPMVARRAVEQPQKPQAQAQPALVAKVPEQPKAEQPKAEPAKPQVQAKAAPVAPTAPAKPKIERVIVAPTPVAPVETKGAGGVGGTVQLGAFSSEAKAKAAWKTLSGRFAMLKDMTPTITPVESGDTKLFRLRANGGETPVGKICAQMRIGGDTCSVVGQ